MGLFNLVDKLVDSASDKVIETVVEVQTKTPYLLGKYTKPTPESLKEMEKFAEEFIDFKNPRNMIEKLKNMSEGELFLMMMMSGHMTREDVQHHFELKDTYSEGVRQGNLEAAKKFAALLKQSDNMRIGAFALGYHVARLGGNSDEKLGVIVDALGMPDSSLLSEYVRSKNNKIIRGNPSFGEICSDYLNSLSVEQLKSVDGFLQEIINTGGSSVNEKNFYQNKWQNYLNTDCRQSPFRNNLRRAFCFDFCQ